MDVPAEVLRAIKCEHCETYLSRGPIYLQHDGTAVCGRCVSPKRPATRMLQYEALAKLMRFPCRNEDLGCRVTVPFVDENEMIEHEEVCEHRLYVCPVFGSARCDWLGTRSDFLRHCSSKHPYNVLQNPCVFTHDITQPSSNTYLLTAFQLLFLVFTKVCLVSGRIYHSVRHLGSTEKATDFKYTVDIKRGAICLCKPGDVAPQGCLAIQEPTSVAMNTNSLLEFLGGFEGTTFTLTIKQATTTKCVKCKKVQPVFVYRDKDGWRCKDCAPPKRPCKFQAWWSGCTHKDINLKCEKHELYFCEKSTKCEICGEAVPQGALSAHYDSAHADVTFRAGSTWWTGWPWQRCLVSSIAGTAVCEYLLDKSYFSLNVFIPVASERLGEFRCEVQLTDPATKYIRTFTPDPSYTEMCDWLIMVYRSEIPNWSGEFDVCVNILKNL